MDELTHGTQEKLPMTSGNEAHNNQNLQLRPSQLLKALSLITTVLVVILAVLSYGVLKDINRYQEKLLAYLPIHAGEIEYSRLPQEYWEHRIQMIKAMGLNSVSIYIMWNHHQKSRGEFDFTSPGKDIAAFLNLTQKYGLQVLLRPGPYVCAQWDFGGLPARLLGVEGLKIRSANALYEAEVRIYFSALALIIKPFLAANGGNIILLQIENEYGYFGEDNRHILNLVQMWKDLGVQCQFYLEDPAAHWQISYWPGAHIGLSQTFSMLRAVDIQLSPFLSNRSLVFGGEVYSGWFTSWGFDWGGVSVDKIASQVQSLLEYNRSFSLYMVFGGTNFGVTAGANGNNGYYQYMPHITSYDYDAPITEQGRATPKFMQLRKLMSQYYGTTNRLPQIPAPIASINLVPLIPRLQAFFWSNLPEPRVINSKLTFFQSSELQMYHQGLVIYETFLPQMRKYEFRANIRDFALIFVDQSFITQILRKTRDMHRFTVLCQKETGCRLRVLVEAMGHKNFGKDQATDRKGLIEFKPEDQQRQYLWNITTVPVNDSSFSVWTSKKPSIAFPAVYKAEFQLGEIGDIYFDMSLYKKGYLSINGHLLGRYWSEGPQQRLFCPGVWLKNGTNALTILQLLEGEPQPIQGYETLKG